MSFCFFVRASLIFCCLMVAGCQASQYEVRIANVSGENLSNVVYSCNKNSFELAVLANNTSKGFMNAGKAFVDCKPGGAFVEFERDSGQSNRVEVIVDGDRPKNCSGLSVSINSAFEAVGKWK